MVCVHSCRNPISIRKEIVELISVVCIVITVLSCIYAPHFANLTLVESVGGAYMRDLTFYLVNTPLLPVPRLDVDITLYYRPIEAADLP